MSELALDVGQANEIKLAARRAGGTNADLKALSEGDMFATILPVLRGRAVVVMKKILTFLHCVSVPAQEAVTTSEKYFREAGIKSMGQNFKDKMFGLKIPATAESILAVSQLEERSLDDSIRDELKRRTHDELVTPTQFTAFLSKNKGSKEWFLFYMEGNDGEIWAICARWDDYLAGWLVRASSVAYPDGWDQGDRVVSQDWN